MKMLTFQKHAKRKSKVLQKETFAMLFWLVFSACTLFVHSIKLKLITVACSSKSIFQYQYLHDFKVISDIKITIQLSLLFHSFYFISQYSSDVRKTEYISFQRQSLFNLQDLSILDTVKITDGQLYARIAFIVVPIHLKTTP